MSAAASAPPSLIDLFCAAVEPACETEPRNVWWCAVGLTSALMGRGVWTSVRAESAADRLFGNLFILLVGPPGVGKTSPITFARKLAIGMGVRLGPDDVSGERLVHFTKTNRWGDDMGADEHVQAARSRRLKRGKKGEEGDDAPSDAERPRGVVSLFLNEFDHLFHAGSAIALKRILTDFYDCRSEPFQRETYQHGTQTVEQMCMSLLGAATPSHMAKVFTRDEWQEGLPSRFLYVWAGDALPMKDEFVPTKAAWERAVRAAKGVQEFISEHQALRWTEGASAARRRWRKAAAAAGPVHPLLLGYNTRRYVSACKLALVLAVARRAPEIDLRDWTGAVEAIEDAEGEIEKTLSHAGGNELRPAMVSAVDWVRCAGRIDEAALRRKLGQVLAPHLVHTVIEELVRAGQLSASGVMPRRFFEAGRVGA